MKRNLLLFFAIIFCSPFISAQISGLYTQDFEGATFPPTGWQVINAAGPSYTWARSTAQAHTSTASAYIRYDTGGGQDWLILPKYQVTATTDSMVFWMRLAFVGYPPDSLSIKVSTTDSLITSFNATPLLGLREGINYPPNSTTWYRYAISLAAYNGQAIFLAFKHQNVDGDGLYIDDVRLGTLPPNEVSTNSINSPGFVATSSSNTLNATVKNNGTASNTFNTTMEINPGGYTSTQTVTSLAPGATSVVNFALWTPSSSGTYTIKVYTQLAGDANHLNDTLTKTIEVLNGFPNYGWTNSTVLPAGRWAGGTAFTKYCSSGTDTAYLYYLAGSDASFSNASVCYKYNLTSNTWQTIANIPNTRTQVGAVESNGKIYVIGGYAGSFAPNAMTQIYDPVTNVWTTGAPMPTAVGDYAIGVYQDSLIYIVGGYNGSGDVNTVQIYNTNTNSWTAGTPKTGTAVAGGRMGISGNKIVFMGGYSQTLAATINDAYLGTIDLVNPTIITWTTISDFPAGNRGRHAGGNNLKNDGRVYFTAGDPNGAGTTVQGETFAYNTLTNAWEIGPNKPTAVSNVGNFTSIIYNDSIYMVVDGGYNGTAVVNANQWLNLGPVDVPYATGTVTSCGPDTTALNAFNGISYSWSPGILLNDSTISNPIAIVNSTTTFTVSIAQKYGCAVDEQVTVTINPLPVITGFTNTMPLCNGNSNGSIQVNATGSPLSYSWNNGDLDNVADNIAAGTYNVTITNTSTGCSVSGSQTLSEPAVLSVNGTAPSSVSCNGDATATIDITVSGGTAGYSYSWSNSAITQDLSGLGAGTYTLSVTDTNGCVDNTYSATITEPGAISVTGTTTDLNCNGNADGAIDITVSGGTPGYTYSWSNLATSQDLSGLSGGTYTLTVTDTNGCINNSFSASIIEPSMLSATCANVVVTGCSGSLTATPSGGTPGYSYLWNDPSAQTTQTATGLCGGNYTCTITDNNGCTSTVAATVTDNTGIEENETGGLTVYPNPFTEQFTISYSIPAANDIEIQLYSIEGKLIYATRMFSLNGNQSIVINPGEIARGIYEIVLKTSDSVIGVKRIIKL